MQGRYAVHREIGRGTMGVVYLAQDLHCDRVVALKVLRPELAASLGSDRFLAEIAFATALAHPNIVPLYDSGDADGCPFFVMPFVEGEALRHRLSRAGSLSLGDLLAMARDVAAAIDYAHGVGVLHRDIKPENILLDGERALLADFGLARAVHVAGEDRLSPSGVAIGTPAYMSPEQARCAPDLDGRSDIYSLGCVLFEALAGEPPFSGATPQAVMRRQLHEQPRALGLVRPDLPRHVAAAIAVALAKSPADRPATGAHLVALLAPSNNTAWFSSTWQVDQRHS